MVATVLVDRRNYADVIGEIISSVASAMFIGLDCETEDSRRHDGLNLAMKVDAEGHKSRAKRLVFDNRRTTMTGFSIHVEGAPIAYYFNLAHLDVANRLTWEEVKIVLDAKPEGGIWLAHNAPYEITMFERCHGYHLDNVVCTMQLSVTAFGDDNYDLNEFRSADLRGLSKWPLILLRAATAFDPGAVTASMDDEDDDGSNRRFNRDVEDIIGKITSKTSDAEHSYNGYIDSMAYGHGLKNLVKTIFGYEMTTFEQTLRGRAHMGLITGDECASYGAEDAFWVVPLFRWLLNYVAANSPNALGTFFEQENPMIYVYSELWQGGMRVNFPAIMSRRDAERIEFAAILRKLRAALRSYEFADEPHPDLAKRQDWYAKGYARYRKKINDWIWADDVENDFEEAIKVKNAVSNAWCDERKVAVKSDFSICHYMPLRVIYYDLLRAKLQFDMGKVASDGDARGKIKLWLERNGRDTEVIELISQLVSVEQRMKLFLTPYIHLTDPETLCLYPTVSSLLNTRRMGASTPNPMQLAKRGESTYIRGFFIGDR